MRGLKSGVGRAIALVVEIAIGAGASFALSSAQAANSADLIARGKTLSEVGDCMACHTAAKGVPYAGGNVIDTPFGAISSPNITPNRQTGIGSWTDDEFYRAMHDGIGKHGEYLYPVMPFPWYTIVTRDDALAIKAYLFSLPPVKQARAPNKLIFPVSIRTSMLAWRQVFFKAAAFQPDPNQSDEVNRGAYLVNGLAHCGECHNARPVAGTSPWRKALQGGVIDNWYAPNITSDARTGIGTWRKEDIATFLKTGVAPGKSIAIGPMTEVVHSLKDVSDADLRAIAAYLKSTPPVNAAPDQKLALFNGQGARGGSAYLNYCASCHGVDGKGVGGVIPALANNGAVVTQGPQNVLRVVLGGLPATHTYGPMPAVGAAMSDDDIADVTNYVRQSWNNAAPPTAAPGMVAALRPLTKTLMNAPQNGSCPAIESKAMASAIADSRNGLAHELSQLRDNTIWTDVASIVGKAKAAAPNVKRDELVNGLTAAYCPVLQQNTALDANAKAIQLGQFSQLAYAASASSLRK